MDGGLVEDGGVAVFDVEDGGAVEGVGPCYVESVSFALQQFYGGDADVIGALGERVAKMPFVSPVRMWVVSSVLSSW